MRVARVCCAVGRVFILSDISNQKTSETESRQRSVSVFHRCGGNQRPFCHGVSRVFDFNFQIPADMAYFVVLMAIASVCTAPDNLPHKSDLSQSSQSTQGL